MDGYESKISKRLREEIERDINAAANRVVEIALPDYGSYREARGIVLGLKRVLSMLDGIESENGEKKNSAPSQSRRYEDF